MTVKELREVLAACNDDAEVIIHSHDACLCILEDENVFQIFDLADEGTVILSTTMEADTVHEVMKRG